MKHFMIGAAVLAASIFSSTATAGPVRAEVSLDGVSWNQVDLVDGNAQGKNPVQFYDYRSASAHTGFEVAGESIMFLYLYNGNVSLFTIHDIEEDTADGAIDQNITGLPTGWTHQVKDDQGNGGLNDTYTTGANSLVADWQWIDNTDGAALGLGALNGLAGTKITVASSNVQGLTDWLFISGTPGSRVVEETLATNFSANGGTAHIRFVIPEPASAMIGMLGLSGLALLRRRIA